MLLVAPALAPLGAVLLLLLAVSGVGGRGEMADICRAQRRDGRRCTAKAGAGGYCFGHDPERAEAHRRGRSAGGKGRSTMRRALRILPGDMQGLLRALSDAFEQTHGGDLDPRVASALASLSGAVVKVYTAGELALRVKALEAREALEERSEP